MRGPSIGAKPASRFPCFACFAIAWASFTTTPTASAAPSDPRTEAFSRFERGRELLAEKRYDEALSEFLESRRIFPSRGNTNNAALCLQELARYDEALEMFRNLRAIVLQQGLKDEIVAVDNSIRSLEAQLGELELTVSEADASVTVDDRAVTTATSGSSTRRVRVKRGTHTIRANKPGFAQFERVVSIAGEQTLEVRIDLESLAQTHVTVAPVPASAVMQGPATTIDTNPDSRFDPSAKTRHPFVEATLAGGFTPALGGASYFGAAARGGYEWTTGVALFAELGYAHVSGGDSAKTSTLNIVGAPSDSGTIDESTALSLFTVMGGVHARRGESWYVQGDVEAGLALGRIHTTRAGRFENSAGSYEVGSASDTALRPGVSSAASFFAFAPGLRVGYALQRRLDVYAALGVLGLVSASKPVWNADLELPAQGRVGFYDAAPLTSSLFAVPKLSFGLRASF